MCPVVQWLRRHLPMQGGVGLIPDWETKIPHASVAKKAELKTAAILQHIQEGL